MNKFFTVLLFPPRLRLITVLFLVQKTVSGGIIPAYCLSLIDFKELITYTQDLKVAAALAAVGRATAEEHAVRGESTELRRRPEPAGSR